MTLPPESDEPVGATPLDPEDSARLIPTWVATRADLDVVEQENITKAMTWAASSSRLTGIGALLAEQTMLDLHRRMFDEVWEWAGTYRQRDTNIGAHWPYIGTRVRDLLADALTQTADPVALPWPADELAIRFHHRLVSIYPFPNRNGRHARLAADLLVRVLDRPVFTWGGADLSRPGRVRTRYLDALRTADTSYDYGPLTAFARS